MQEIMRIEEINAIVSRFMLVMVLGVGSADQKISAKVLIIALLL
jgi:hypothetical protein